MRIAIALSIVLALSRCPCQAAFTDFSDFAQSQTFATGETFQSRGIEFCAVDLAASSGSVQVIVDTIFDFSFLIVAQGVEFQLPVGIQEISFNYGNGGGRLFMINGIEPPSPNDASLSFLDGQTVAGVFISATDVVQSVRPSFGVTSEEGFLTLRGPISSLALAGVEFSIDNVTVRVPEPSAAALLLIAATVTMTRRRRQAGRLRLGDRGQLLTLDTFSMHGSR